MSKYHLTLAAATLAALLATSVKATAQPPQVTYGPAVVVGAADAQPGLALPCAPVCTKKICVAEPKKNTKVVYDEVCKDYCRRTCHCSLFGLFGKGCDSCSDACGDGCRECGRPQVKHVLVKRNRPDCDTTNCVVKEVPACEESISASMPAAVPFSPPPSPQPTPHRPTGAFRIK